MIKNLLLALALIPSIAFGASDYRTEPEDMLFEKGIAYTKRDESSGATLNAMATTTSYVKLVSTVSTINGMAAPADSNAARLVIISNMTGAEVTISHASASASAANRFDLPDGDDMDVPDRGSATFLYDQGAQRWVQAGGGGGGVAFTAVAPIDYDPLTKQLSCIAATGSVAGCLQAADFTTFNSKQAGDADLSSIAAIAGTNVIPIRSAANTWSTVTIGTGLDLTGGVLSSTVTLPVTTKGDLLGYGASATRVPVGSNDQALVADSTLTNGVGYKRRDPFVRNYVRNHGAEYDATTGVTATNTTVSRNTSSPLYDSADFSFTIDSATDVVEWALDAFDNELKNDICEVSGRFTADANGENVQLQLYRNSVAVGSKNLWTTGTSQPQEFGIYAPCGDLTNTTTLRVVGTAATSTAMKLDHLEVTKMRGISRSQVGNAFVAGITWPGVSNCEWSRTSSASFADFSADSDCTLPASTRGAASLPATKVPSISLTAVSVGKLYKLIARGGFQSAGSAVCAWRFSDGTDSASAGMIGEGAAVTGSSLIGYYRPSTGGAKTITIQATGANGSVACRLPNSYTAGALDIDVEVMPDESEVLTAAAKSGNYGPTPYTPTFTGLGSVTIANAKDCTHARQDNFLLVDCKGTMGTGTATEARISFPNNLLPDVDAVAQMGQIFTSVNEQAVSTPLVSPGNSYFTIGYANGGAAAPLTARQGSSLWATGATFSLQARVPIKGWTKSATSASITGEPGAWHGFLEATTGDWGSSSASPGDLTNASGIAVTEKVNNNFGTVTCGASGAPTCQFTPKGTGVYNACWAATAFNSGNNTSSMAMYDGSNNQITGFSGFTSASASYNHPVGSCGLISLTAGTSTTLKIRGAANGGTVRITAPTGNPSTKAHIAFTIYPVTQNLPGLFGGGSLRVPSTVDCRQTQGGGSTNTKVRRYDTCTNNGADIAVSSDSSTLGRSFTVNTAGTYSINVGDFYSGSEWVGVSVNGNALTTAVHSITKANGLIGSVAYGNGQAVTNNVTWYFNQGDVIRTQCATCGAIADDRVMISIVGPQ